MVSQPIDLYSDTEYGIENLIQNRPNSETPAKAK